MIVVLTFKLLALTRLITEFLKPLISLSLCVRFFSHSVCVCERTRHEEKMFSEMKREVFWKFFFSFYGERWGLGFAASFFSLGRGGKGGGEGGGVDKQKCFPGRIFLDGSWASWASCCCCALRGVCECECVI